ncbi:MAG TPA: hypothetical protein VEZ11_16005 [Thermoanaerobaculia bacterium]|nr:hypothetical protein [Thermoanaerobaculia bacterium]
MLLIRNVFHCKPGQAKVLVKMMKETLAATQAAGVMSRGRVMTDIASTFWTVVLETEADSFEAWERESQAMGTRPELRKAMEGYMDLVEGGYREIFKIE